MQEYSFELSLFLILFQKVSNMGNIFSDCFQVKKTKTQGYRLGDNNTTTNNATIGSRKTNEQSLNGSGRTTGGSGGGPSREDALAAAQKRQDEVSKIIIYPNNMKVRD